MRRVPALPNNGSRRDRVAPPGANALLRARLLSPQPPRARESRRRVALRPLRTFLDTWAPPAAVQRGVPGARHEARSRRRAPRCGRVARRARHTRNQQLR